jgi:hypothetical protein
MRLPSISVGLGFILATVGFSIDSGSLITASLVTYLLCSSIHSPSMPAWVSLLLFAHMCVCFFRRGQDIDGVESYRASGRLDGRTFLRYVLEV